MVEKMNEVAVVPPQEVGILTPVYKMFVPRLKFYPWRWGVIASLAMGVFLYLVFGVYLVKLASLLQFGF